MKRISTLIGCFIALTSACFAQDVIVTKDSRRIEAKVTEVNVDDIKYKRSTNPDGPTYSLPKSSIDYILYQNGEVERFETENTRIQTTTTSRVQTQNQRTTQPDQYYRYSKRELLDRMQRDDPILFRQYRSGVSKTAHGWAFIGTGLVLNGIGIGVIVDGTNKGYGYYTYDDTDQIVAGYITTLVGDVFLTIGIPTAIVGKVRRVRALNAYEQKIYYGETKRDTHFKINLYGNGLGLAYVF